MEEARQVLARLARIEALDRRSAPPEEVLGELRELVREAEAWVRSEGEAGDAAHALDRCRDALAVVKPEEVALLAG
jgi:hypothetical protein